MWLYKSPFGTFRIQRLPSGRFQLFFRGEPLGTYPDPESAAGDVVTGTTGADPWDERYLDVSSVPSGLLDWEHQG